MSCTGTFEYFLETTSLKVVEVLAQVLLSHLADLYLLDLASLAWKQLFVGLCSWMRLLKMQWRCWRNWENDFPKHIILLRLHLQKRMECSLAS